VAITMSALLLFGRRAVAQWMSRKKATA